MVQGVERWVHWLNPVINGLWNSCVVWRQSPDSGSETKISGFFRLKWYLSGQNAVGHQNSFLVPLKNCHYSWA